MNHSAISSRRTFLRGMMAAAMACATSATDAAAQRGPNVVLVMVDDLGWADIGCYGSEYHQTPNIDRLAAEGMKFTDFYAAAAICSPTRAAVMTGRYPARLRITNWIRARFQKGIVPAPGKAREVEYVDEGKPLVCPDNASALELDEVTLAEVLKGAGYATCHIGKWHLGTDEFYPEKQGFDVNVGGCDMGEPPSYFDPYVRKSGVKFPHLPPRKAGQYLTDRETDEALEFIRANREKPFFLNLWHYAVHTPIEAKPELLEKYKARPTTHQKNPAYATMVESVDQCMGRIVALLDELKLAGNTIVIFTSDNGGLMGPTSNVPLRNGKGTPYEGGIRVPMIVRWPGVVAPGTRTSQPAMSIDFMPTLCEAVGARLPADKPIDGVSLLPVLKQRGELKRDALYWHFPHYRPPIVPYSVIRDGEWKLIKWHEGKPSELYNLKNDLSEKENLAEKEPGRVKQLERKLTLWLEQTGALLPRRKQA